MVILPKAIDSEAGVFISLFLFFDDLTLNL